MATLEKIRSRAALLIGVIAFALFAFIVGDFLKSPQGGASQGVIIEVNGNKVYVNDYQARLAEMNEVYKINSGSSALDENTSNQITSQVYESILRENILFPQFEEIGLSVSKDELDDRILGANVDPIIKQMFTDPNTGQYNSSMVLNYLKSVNQDEQSARKTHWLFYERLIKENRLNSKYNNLLAKGIVVTPKAAALSVPGVSTNKSVEFFSKPYSYIADSLVKVSESDIKSYYNEHLENYRQDESRKIEYITFPIEASQADFKAVENWINEEKPDFAALTVKKDIGNYVKLNSDISWDETYKKEDGVEARFKEFAFNEEVGSVYGSYMENDTYKMTKLVAREMRSDSVKASHILITGTDPAAANQLADSLLEVAKKQPESFADLATEYSEDPGSAAQGGDLGYFKEEQMVKPFSDACFNGEKGDIVKVTSQFGIHVIKITEKGKAVEKVQLATVARKVEPSTETYRTVYSEASKFIGANNTFEKFNEGVKADENITMRTALNLGKNDKVVNGIQNARELVKWAYTAEVGTLSEILEIDDQFIIAALTDVSEEGYKPVKTVSLEIQNKLINDKKAELITEEIAEKKAESQTLSSLAQKMGESIKSAQNINFQSYQVTGAGVEPALVGAISYANENEISEPIKGTSGVFVFRVTSAEEAVSATTSEDLAETLSRSYGYRVGYQAFSALRDGSDIVDDRYMFY